MAASRYTVPSFTRNEEPPLVGIRLWRLPGEMACVPEGSFPLI